MDRQAKVPPSSDAGPFRIVSGSQFSSALSAEMRAEHVRAFRRLAWRLLLFTFACLLLAAWIISGAHPGALGAAGVVAVGVWVGSLVAAPVPGSPHLE